MADDTTTAALAAAPAAAPSNPTPVAAAPAVQPMPAAPVAKPSGPPVDPPAPAEPMPAVDRLRAFEDAKLGADAPRFQGKVERGVGSLFSRMSDADRAHHGKLEKLVDAEDKLSAAHAALIAADTEHEAAMKAVDDGDAGK